MRFPEGRFLSAATLAETVAADDESMGMVGQAIESALASRSLAKISPHSSKARLEVMTGAAVHSVR